MAVAATAVLLNKVSKLLTSGHPSISGAESELQLLQNELRLLKSFLEQVGMMPNQKFFEEVERQIMKVAYEAEDIIDSSIQAQRSTNNFFRRSLRANRVELAREIRYYRDNAVKPMLEQAKMVFDTMKSDTSAKKPIREEVIRQDNVVAVEDEEETIIKHLLGTNQQELDVISIIGMAGLGKTTLAWKIYRNEAIRYHFPVCIWVNVSQGFNRKEVFLKILRQFTQHDKSSLSDQELSQTIYEYLERGKFFLVLDDVCSVDDWNYFRGMLPRTNLNSRVLITSRYTNVARHANPTREPHCLRFMTQKESWQLLQLEVFGKQDDCPQELIEIGKHIAQQCDGLPLAIIIVGGVLVGNVQQTKNKWVMVSENMSQLLRDKDQHALPVLELSYNGLPHDLRDCFLYLAIFPKNYEIPVRTLINLWIAEGFIQQKWGNSLEETAEENLKDLIGRSLIMVDKISAKGKVKTCRVHGLIHAFCKYKADIKQRNLFQEIEMSKSGVFDPPIFDLQNYYRVCIHSNLLKFLDRGPRSKSLRSLLCFSETPFILDPTYNSVIPDAFCSLRVLGFNSIKFAKFPNRVTKLVHLRYITLSCDDIKILPETISELLNLETLIVDTKSPSIEMEANIWQMIQLRHVKTKAAIGLNIKGRKVEVAEDLHLQTLTRLSPKSCTEDVFKRAPHLKKLGIRGQLATHLDAKCLTNLHGLENLKLVNDHESASQNQFSGLPHDALNCFPVTLKMLALSATYLNWEHLSTLQKINTLQVLKLKNYAFTGKSWKTVGNGFPSLEFLLIANTDLVSWETSTDHFPSLWCLVVENCQELTEIPKGLAKLKKLEIGNLSQSAVESARKIEKEIGSGFKLIIGPGRQ